MGRRKKLTVQDRASFSFHKVLSASKWLVASGVVTYALLELQKLLGSTESLKDYAPMLVVVINIVLFAVAKYREGEE